MIVDQTIEKVSFCAPDRNHEKGFSYICRDGTTRRWMCHGFLASKDSVRIRSNKLPSIPSTGRMTWFPLMKVAVANDNGLTASGLVFLPPLTLSLFFFFFRVNVWAMPSAVLLPFVWSGNKNVTRSAVWRWISTPPIRRLLVRAASGRRRWRSVFKIHKNTNRPVGTSHLFWWLPFFSHESLLLR